MNAAADDWLCRTNSSQVTGKTVTACGVAKSSSEQNARAAALDAASYEFHNLCSQSDTCPHKNVAVRPLRTECEEKAGMYTCYRAVEFQVLDTDKKDRIVDIQAVESEIEQQQMHLKTLDLERSRLQDLAELKVKNEQAQKEIEAKALTLKEEVRPESVRDSEYKYTNLLYHNSLKFDVGYNGIKATRSGEVNGELSASYEYRLSNYVGLRGRVGFGYDLGSRIIHSASEVPTSGPANTSEQKPGASSFVDFSVAPIIYTGVAGIYLVPEVGTISGSRKTYNVSYGALGISSSTTTTESFSGSYYGLSIGWDSRKDYKGVGWYFEVGAKKASGLESNSISPNATVGLSFGF
jgi:hypothetical protein